jgi:hypothetical protein
MIPGVIAAANPRRASSAFARSYGPGLTGDFLQNSAINNGPSGVNYYNNFGISFRMRSPTTANLTHFSIFITENGPGFNDGYGGGTGGTLRFTWCADSAGQPGTSISTPLSITRTQWWFNAAHSNNSNGTCFVQMPDVLSTTMSVPMTANSIYHLKIENTDASPGTNYVSVDQMGGDEASILQPFCLGDQYRWGQMVKLSSGGAYIFSYIAWPILEMMFDDGTVYGANWRECINNAADVGQTVAIGGSSTNNQVRQVFTPSANRGPFNTVRVLINGSGATPTATIKTSGGTTIATGAMSLDPVYANPLNTGTTTLHWWIFSFSSFTFLSGTTYYLLITAPASGSLRAWSIRKASVESGVGIFHSGSDFPDGHGEATTNNWSSTISLCSPTYDGPTFTPELDMCFMMSLE